MADLHKTSPDIILLGEREQQLDMLLHVQEFSAMAVFITGSTDIGKTALLEAAVTQLSVHHQVIHIQAFTTNQLADLIDEIALQLGCDANLVDLDHQLAKISQQEETLHLVIDDAHLLDDDDIMVLFEKSALAHGWRLILCGDESLKSRLDILQAQFEHKLYHLIELSSLTEDESEIFITQLFKRAGIDVVPISIKDMHQLWLLSKGVPGKLIELVELEQDNHKQRSSRFPIGHMAAVCLIGSALLVSYFYQEQDAVANIDGDDAIAQLLLEQQVRLSDGEDSSLGLSTKEMTMEPAEAVSSNEPKQKQINPSVPTKEVGPVIAESKNVKASSSLTSDIETIPKRVETQSSSIGKISNALNDKVTLSKPLKKAPRHPLLSAPSQSYALQLLGVRNKSSAQKFVQRFARQMDGSKLNIYETRYKGEPWFVVVYGPMDNKQQANKQANQLSKTLKGQPWVRPISKIQADIRQIE